MNRRFFSILFLLALTIPTLVWAQPRGRLPPNLQTPDQLNPGEGDTVLQQFRSVGPDGDLIFEFQFNHQPHRGESVQYRGRLAGTWATGAPRTLIELASEKDDRALHLLQWNGPEPRTWMLQKSEGQLPQIIELERDKLFEPLIADVTFTAFELQMPFIYWTDYAYEGTRRVRGRPAHFFLLYPPEDDVRYSHLGGVRAVIDADFNVILRAEILDPEGKVLRTIQAHSFKRVDGQWIVRRIDLIDQVTRDRTRFEVTAAAVGLLLEPERFRPDSLGQAFPDDHALQPL